MEANKEEAAKAFELARECLKRDLFPKAAKLLKMALRMDPTLEDAVKPFLEEAESRSSIVPIDENAQPQAPPQPQPQHRPAPPPGPRAPFGASHQQPAPGPFVNSPFMTHPYGFGVPVPGHAGNFPVPAGGRVGAPAAPPKPSVVHTSLDSVTVSWAAPYDGGFPIQQYFLHDQSGKVIAVGGATTTCEVKELHPGTRYAFRLAAVNAAGIPDCVAFTDSLPPAPAAPALGTMQGATVALTWAPLAMPSGASKIAAYTARRPRPAPARPGPPHPARAEPAPQLYQNGQAVASCPKPKWRGTLEPFTAYEFAVAASNGAGEGPRSAPLKVVTSGAPPAKPNGPAALSVGTASVTLSWTASGRGAGRVDGFALSRGDEELYRGPETSFAVAGLEPGTAYEFRLVAYNQAGASPVASARIVTDCPPPPPGPPSVVPLSHSGVSLSWAPPAVTVGSKITSYTVYANGGAIASVRKPAWKGTLDPFAAYEFHVTATNAAGDAAGEAGGPRGGVALRDVHRGLQGAALLYEVAQLRPGTEYSFRVAAFNSSGEGAAATAALRTEAGVRLERASSDSLAVRFDPPAFNGGADVIGFHVQARPRPSGRPRPGRWRGAASGGGAAGGRMDGAQAPVEMPLGLAGSVEIPYLLPDAPYRVAVCAENEKGKGPWSEALVARTLPSEVLREQAAQIKSVEPGNSAGSRAAVRPATVIQNAMPPPKEPPPPPPCPPARPKPAAAPAPAAAAAAAAPAPAARAKAEEEVDVFRTPREERKRRLEEERAEARRREKEAKRARRAERRAEREARRARRRAEKEQARGAAPAGPEGGDSSEEPDLSSGDEGPAAPRPPAQARAKAQKAGGEEDEGGEAGVQELLSPAAGAGQR
eukprot:tig00001636_g9527.t1